MWPEEPPQTWTHSPSSGWKKVWFPLHSFFSVRKTTLPFQFKRGKTYTGKWNMSWSFWLCNSIVNSESGSNLVIMSDHSSDWVGHKQYQSSIRLLSVIFIFVDEKQCRSYIMFNTGRDQYQDYLVPVRAEPCPGDSLIRTWCVMRCNFLRMTKLPHANTAILGARDIYGNNKCSLFWSKFIET